MERRCERVRDRTGGRARAVGHAGSGCVRGARLRVRGLQLLELLALRGEHRLELLGGRRAALPLAARAVVVAVAAAALALGLGAAVGAALGLG